MLRTIFVILSAVIVVLVIFLGATSYDLHYMVRLNEANKAKIDSLEGEAEIMRMNVDRLDFIVNQIREKHPKEVDDIMNETE